MMRYVARGILALFGWRIEGTIPDTIRKYVVIAAPHTSWWDFPLGLLGRCAIGRKIHFLGKKSLFKPPVGWLMRLLGGYPVDRSRHTRQVDQVVELFNSKEEFAIALAPEGTRKRVDEFKTGFYYIARGAQVPVICASLDFGNRKVIFSEPFFPTENAERDLRLLWKHFTGVRGKRPAQGIFDTKSE
jgi:1-acyl-sn-glycerol-3-phosphate acyltransferase